MKILVVATTFPRSANDTIPQFLLGYTEALVRAGAEVTVIAPHDYSFPEHEVINGVTVHRVVYWLPRSAQGLCYGAGIPTNVRRKAWLAMQFPTLELAFFRAAIKYGGAADILNPHWTFAGLPTTLASKLLRKPMVTHAYTAEFIPKTLRPFNHFILRNSSAVISISDYAAKKVEELHRPKRHKIIGYGVNREKIAPSVFDRMLFRHERNIDDDEFLVFAVGRLVERKGYRVLIQAVERLVERGRRVKMLHSGRGPLRDRLQKQIDDAGLSDKITLMGFIPDTELRYYLKAADVVVMPSVMDQSQDTEGLGIPLLEAMANDTPAIGSAIGGITSIIEDNTNGLLFPPGDVEALVESLERVYTNKTLRDRLVMGGRETVSTTYDWDQIAKRVLGIFEECISP